jgi:hypothetical protein
VGLRWCGATPLQTERGSHVKICEETVIGGIAGGGDRSASPEQAGERAMHRSRRTATLRPGTVLGREWNGQMQKVAALAEGFAWNGKTYPGLYQIGSVDTGKPTSRNSKRRSA